MRVSNPAAKAGSAALPSPHHHAPVVRTRRRVAPSPQPEPAQGWAQHGGPEDSRRGWASSVTPHASARGSPAPGFNWSGIKKDLLAPQQGQSTGSSLRELSSRPQQQQQQQLPADAVTGKLASVVFHLKYKTSFGQSVKLLGGHPKLGSWNLKDALEMRWTTGDQWVANVQLPAGGVYEYKYVLVDYETKQALEWQHGSNAVLAVVVSESEVNVYDNWGNGPGSKVEVEQESMTRENKLQKWATEMLGYWKEARKLQIELAHKNSESQALRNDLAQLRMELSLEKQQRVQAEQQIQELRLENAGLRAQLVQKSMELNRTLAEVLQLLDQELDDESAVDEDEEEGEEYLEEEHMDDHMEHEDDDGHMGHHHAASHMEDHDDQPQAYSAAGAGGRSNGYRSRQAAASSNGYQDAGYAGYGAAATASSRFEWSRNGTH